MEGRKNKMVKAVFFDIDGTLLDHGRGGVMPDSTKRSLHVLRDKGVKLFVATGRFPAMVTFMEAMFPFDGYVTMNGQLVVLADGSVIHRLGHHPEDIRCLDAVSRQKGFPSLIIEEDAYFYTVPSPETHLYPAIFSRPGALTTRPGWRSIQFCSFSSTAQRIFPRWMLWNTLKSPAPGAAFSISSPKPAASRWALGRRRNTFTSSGRK